MKTLRTTFAILLAVASLAGGCANTDSRPTAYYSSGAYGVVDAIEMIPGSSGGIGAGTVIGGVVGGVLGHQIGGGTGKDIATAAGVVGGAVAGHQIEKSHGRQDTYRIRVRLENGGYETVTQPGIGDLRVGDRVIVENNHVSRY